MIAPCKGCEERTVYCHTTCEKYKEFRIFREMALAEKYKYIEGQYTSQSAKSRLRKKLNERKRGRK